MVSAISTSRMVSAFQALLPTLETDVGGPVHLVRMRGTRSSFVAGDIPSEMPFVASKRIMLNEEWALLVYPSVGRDVDREKIRVLFKNQIGE